MTRRRQDDDLGQPIHCNACINQPLNVVDGSQGAGSTRETYLLGRRLVGPAQPLAGFREPIVETWRPSEHGAMLPCLLVARAGRGRVALHRDAELGRPELYATSWVGESSSRDPSTRGPRVAMRPCGGAVCYFIQQSNIPHPSHSNAWKESLASDGHLPGI
jgi:hypothetical protein